MQLARIRKRAASALGEPSAGDHPREPSRIPAELTALLQRADALAGRTLGELAATEGIDVPTDLRRNKGWVGQLMERCLDAPGGNRQGPDFASLQVELKTLPTNRAGKPLESTYVTRVPLTALAERTWELSPVRAKLRRVLFVPVLGNRDVPLAERPVGRAIFWRPSPEEENTLRADWETHLDRIRNGEVESITARDGVALQIRPKGSDSREQAWGEGAFEAVIRTRPRGFYLRARFTARIVEAYLENAIPAPLP